MLLALSVTSFPIPLVGIVQPQGITTGPDGNLWFAETGADKIGRMTPAGAVTQFPLPPIPVPAETQPNPGSAPGPRAITVGPDGALWFVGVPGEVGRITTAGVVTEFAVPAIPPPAGSAAGTAPTVLTPSGITVGPDGALWFTAYPASGDSYVGRITATGAVTEYAATGFDLGSTIVTGSDGNLWMFGTQYASGDNAIGRITPAGVFTTFTVPGNFSEIAGLTAGPNGNVWFTEEEDGFTVGEQPAVGEITPAGVTTLFPIPQGTTLDPSRGVNVDPTAITSGPDGAIWFTDLAGIGRITTGGTIEQFPLTTPGATAQNITSGPDDTLWFTQYVLGRKRQRGRLDRQDHDQRRDHGLPASGRRHYRGHRGGS